MNAKYEEDDWRRTDDGLYLQARCAVVPWIRAKPVETVGPAEPRHPLRKLGHAPAYLWFAEGIEVEPTVQLKDKLKPFWNGHLFVLPLNTWVSLGHPPVGYSRPALLLPKIPRLCEIAHTAKGGVIRVLNGSLPIYIRNYRITKRFFLRELDCVLSGIFFLTRLPPDRPII